MINVSFILVQFQIYINQMAQTSSLCIWLYRSVFVHTEMEIRHVKLSLFLLHLVCKGSYHDFNPKISLRHYHEFKTQNSNVCDCSEDLLSCMMVERGDSAVIQLRFLEVSGNLMPFWRSLRHRDSEVSFASMSLCT